MRVTIKEIAKRANVSRGTVDKVLNHRPGVKKETMERVQAIIEELNYTPNIIGKALVQSNHPYRLLIILTPDHNPYIREIKKGIEQGRQEFHPFGIEVDVKILHTLDPAEELDILNTFESDGYSGLAIFPIDHPDVRSRINQISDQNFPVISFNSQIFGIHPLCHVGQNHYKGGYIAASLLCKQLPPNAQIGIVTSSNTLSCHPSRIQGFQDRLLRDNSNHIITEIRENQDKDDLAYQITLDYCKKYPDLKAIYISGGGISGVGQALFELSKNGIIKVICHDITSDSQEMLHRGVVDFALSQASADQGYQIVKIFFEYIIKGQPPVSDFIEMPVTIFIDELLYS
ncbi:MAG: LacI family DNA-binding transcriptional regulator [Eubacteriales bacterium]|nr:LacI family DNA-binding transcriptional regulator [Eubacteriales bacterium]